MWVGIIAAITVIGQLISLGVKIWDAIKEQDVELRKKQTTAIQSAARAIVDRDASRLNSSINDINKLRK